MKRHEFDSRLHHRLVRELSTRSLNSLRVLHWPKRDKNDTHLKKVIVKAKEDHSAFHQIYTELPLRVRYC